MRQFFEIVLPLVLPTLLYLGYVMFARSRGAAETPEIPWIWLVIAGGALVAVTFAALALFGGAPPSDVYRPPKIINGTVQPGEFSAPGNKPSGN
jgi:hypothetical protein